MATVEVYVRTDEYGVMRVGSTRVMLDSVLTLFEQGESPDSIRRAYPSLSLEQVYGAITYILSHPTEVEAYKKQQDETWAEIKGQIDAQPEAPVVARLRALKAARGAERS